ncbi:hypothetical protein THAOC_22205 [Thalassiosira oceanica]|uniref:Anaphase-promoting complex subunit CDC26 n=1 Tax=Thalassiosira oceanica TaxID=159749 RepID=K0S9Y4_THAOC|nr:hypothetical protein THAOC_22205 [Thalassiosira oceanica]|eukprot:EJK57726.1 hypothetical protein THAOC_22205 [Thalassiosira oceanica]
MALRRPPTRIELKADDVEDYDRIMKERRLQAEQQAMKASQLKSHATPSADISLGMDSFAPSSKKPSASERIGYRQQR